MTNFDSIIDRMEANTARETKAMADLARLALTHAPVESAEILAGFLSNVSDEDISHINHPNYGMVADIGPA